MAGIQQVAATNFFGDNKQTCFVCPETPRTSPLRVSTFLPACARSSNQKTALVAQGGGGGGVNEADLPKPYTQTKAVVMKPDTPTTVLRMATGLHQPTQRSPEETTFNEIIGSLAELCHQREGKSQKNWTLNGDEIWSIIQGPSLEYKECETPEKNGVFYCQE